MPDLGTFEARERKRINGKVGCFGIAAGIATIVFALSVVFGWRKMAVAMILGPVALLFVPLYYWFETRKLKQALTRRNPASVVEFFVRDVNETLASEGSSPAYAYEALSPETRAQAGDLETFTSKIRASLTDLIAAGLQPELKNGTCVRCSTGFEYVLVPSECSALQGAPVRCACGAVYCATCVPEVLKDEDKLFGERFLCACGKKLASSNVKLLPRAKVGTPYLQIGHPRRTRTGDREDVQVETTAMYRDTGVSKQTESGGVVQTKAQAFVTGAMTIAFPMRRIQEQWFIDSVPAFVASREPVKTRWVEAPEQAPF